MIGLSPYDERRGNTTEESPPCFTVIWLPVQHPKHPKTYTPLEPATYIIIRYQTLCVGSTVYMYRLSIFHLYLLIEQL